MSHLTVHPGWVGVVRVDGVTTDVLAAGRHRLPMRLRPLRRSVVRVDVRGSLLLVLGQEVSAADVPGVKVSAAVSWHVSDPVRWLEASTDPLDEVRLAAQIAVRDWAAASEVSALVTGRAGAGVVVLPAVARAGERVGVAVTDVVVRDVVLPVEVRRATLALATAQLEGRASLERARAETAALRALANAGRLLADNPALVQLRTVEAAAANGGSVVLHMGGAGSH